MLRIRLGMRGLILSRIGLCRRSQMDCNSHCMGNGSSQSQPQLSRKKRPAMASVPAVNWHMTAHLSHKEQFMSLISGVLPLTSTGQARHLQKSDRWKRLFAVLSGYFLLARTSVGQNPSVPVTEVSVKAGEIFSVKFPITSPTTLTYRFVASVSYRLEGTKTTQQYPDPSSFPCSGRLDVNASQGLILQCQTTRQNAKGVYRAFGPVVLTPDQPMPLAFGQPAPNGRQEYASIRLPIVTVTPAEPFPVLPPVVFPELGDGQLQLSAQQAFYDGGVRMGPIVDELQKHAEFGKRNSRSNRQALANQLLATATVLEVTRKRYIDADAATKRGSEVPPLFRDFRMRLEVVAKLLTTPLPQQAMLYDRTAHLQLTQLPRSSTSIDVIPEGDSLLRPYEELLFIATDMSHGFSAVAKTGETKFTWTLITVPPGADIYLSSLSHPEFKWQGSSDQKEKTLDLARWTFRVSWNGCSQTETPDPFIQNPLTITLRKSGCKN